MVLELSVKVEVLSDDVVDRDRADGAPGARTGRIEFGGVRIESGRSQAPLPSTEAPKPPAKVTDPEVLFLESAGKLVALPGLADSAEFQKITIEVGKLAGSIDGLDLRNRNTHRRVSITDVALVDATQRGDYVPARAHLRGRGRRDDHRRGHRDPADERHRRRGARRDPDPEGALEGARSSWRAPRRGRRSRTRSSRSWAPTTGSSPTWTCSRARTRPSSTRPGT